MPNNVVSVAKVAKTGSRIIVTEMPEDKAAIHILKCEDGTWAGTIQIYMTIDGLETLHDALSVYFHKRNTNSKE